MATTKKTKTKTTQRSGSSGSGQVRKKTSSRRTKENRRTMIIFWVALVLFLLPFIILGFILLSAAMDTGKPIFGDRYKDDLDPAITSADLSKVESAVKGVGGVENTFTNLATGTLRVYADISDSADAESAKASAEQVYSAVTSVLNPGTYFTQNNGKKMYDLEVHVFNQNKDTENNFVYVIETKTSSMEAPIVQLVSEPIDAELAESLRQDVENRNNPTPTPAETDEMTVGEGEVEQLPDDTEPAPENGSETTENSEG
ncbi:MAG: hypothetical protein IKE28_02525 [Solobacterium sp.]|nr:hypothetical protein [Solobacterium sp.]